MRFSLPVLALAAAATVVASAAVYGDYKTYNLRKYTEPNMKCAGAPGKPYVHYAPCTKGYHCVAKTTYGKHEWGLFCLPVPKSYAPKCYDDGARCMGAANKPYVPYFSCCKASSICKEVPSMGWGSFCVGKGADYAPPKKTDYVPKPTKDDVKGYAPVKVEGVCHITGVRCSGAPGYPYYEYGDGCCSGHDVCIPVAGKGWGNFCVKKGAKKSYEPEPVYKKPADYEPYAPKKDDTRYYPKPVVVKDPKGHGKWGGDYVGGHKTGSYNPKCVATDYYGCKVAPEHTYYYRMLITSRSYWTKDFTSLTGCCSAKDVCYKGFCMPKTALPGSPTGKPVGPGNPGGPVFPSPDPPAPSPDSDTSGGPPNVSGN